MPPVALICITPVKCGGRWHAPGAALTVDDAGQAAQLVAQGAARPRDGAAGGPDAQAQAGGNPAAPAAAAATAPAAPAASTPTQPTQPTTRPTTEPTTQPAAAVASADTPSADTESTAPEAAPAKRRRGRAKA